jgi:hypothetical protein
MSPVAEAERRVIESRGELRLSVLRLRARVTRPSVVVGVVAVSALLAFFLARRGGTTAVAGPLATALLLRGVDYWLSRASTPRAAPPTPSA